MWEHKVLEKILEANEALLKLNLEVLEELCAIRREIAPQRLTKSVANIFLGESLIMANNVLVLTVGQTSTDVITPFLADGTTPSGGVVSNVVVTFSDPSATAVVQADNSVLFTGVAPSAGPISGSTTCKVTDTDGAVSTWNTPFTVTVNAVVPPAQLTQSVVNTFSVPA